MVQSELQKIFSSTNDFLIRQTAFNLGRQFLDYGNEFLSEDQISVEKLTLGQSNLLFRITEKSRNRSFLIRIHCQPDPRQIFVDTVIFSILSERKLGPKLLGIFEGGRLEEYLDSRTLNEENVQEENIAWKIGAIFPKFHNLEIPIKKSAGSIETIRKWLQLYKNQGGKKHEIKPLYAKYSDNEVPSEVRVEELEKEIEEFEKMAQIYNDTIVFSHNDLAAMNILEMNESKEIVFIDFEYASYNWRGFDLGMHLSEYAFDYRINEPPYYKVNPSIFEDHPTIRIFCESYIDKLYKIKSESPTRKFPKSDDRQAEVNQLMKECVFFWPFCNLFWAIWSLKNEISGFENGIELGPAASDRLAIYYHLKPRSKQIFEEMKK